MTFPNVPAPGPRKRGGPCQPCCLHSHPPREYIGLGADSGLGCRFASFGGSHGQRPEEIQSRSQEVEEGCAAEAESGFDARTAPIGTPSRRQPAPPIVNLASLQRGVLPQPARADCLQQRRALRLDESFCDVLGAINAAGFARGVAEAERLLARVADRPFALTLRPGGARIGLRKAERLRHPPHIETLRPRAKARRDSSPTPPRSRSWRSRQRAAAQSSDRASAPTGPMPT